MAETKDYRKKSTIEAIETQEKRQEALAKAQDQAFAKRIMPNPTELKAEVLKACVDKINKDFGGKYKPKDAIGHNIRGDGFAQVVFSDGQKFPVVDLAAVKLSDKPKPKKEPVPVSPVGPAA